MTSLLLAFLNMNRELTLTTDACNSGIGYILSQPDELGREHVISYGGRGLHPKERNFPVTQLECLAVIEGTNVFYTYLANMPYVVVTDHISLNLLQFLKVVKRDGRFKFTERCKS
jgi:hypothetical protein